MPLLIIIIINHYTTCNHPNLNIDRSYGMRPSNHLTSAGQPKAMVQKITNTSFQNLCIASVQLDDSYSMKDLDNNGIHHKTLFLYISTTPTPTKHLQANCSASILLYLVIGGNRWYELTWGEMSVFV